MAQSTVSLTPSLHFISLPLPLPPFHSLSPSPLPSSSPVPYSLCLPFSLTLSPLSPLSAVVDIFPEIPDVNISTYHTDADVTIGCPVQTCAEEVTVQFLRGDQVVKSSEESLTGEHSVFNLVLTVSDSITGLYACKVDTTNPDASTLKQFDVLGKLLKSIRIHLSPGSSCGLVAYTLCILVQRYTFFMGHTAIFLLVGIKV